MFFASPVISEFLVIFVSLQEKCRNALGLQVKILKTTTKKWPGE